MPGKHNDRRLDFYFSSEAEKKRFRAEARKHGCTACRYLRHIIDEHFHHPLEPSTVPQDIQNLKEEISRLKKDLREADLLTKVQDELIQSLRNQLPIQTIDDQLIEAIQNGPIHDRKLLETLGIDMSNGDAIRAISRQLEILEANGMITRNARGWSWKA